MNRSGLFVLSCLLAGCLSSGPPAPPVRFFDATPEGAPVLLPVKRVVVDSEPHIGQDFAVRVGEREVAIDAGNRWLTEPAAFVTAALRAGSREPDAAELLVHIERFELDVTGTPRAHVRLRLVGAIGPSHELVDVFAAAADRSPAALAVAMADAVARAAAAVAAAFAS